MNMRLENGKPKYIDKFGIEWTIIAYEQFFKENNKVLNARIAKLERKSKENKDLNARLIKLEKKIKKINGDLE